MSLRIAAACVLRAAARPNRFVHTLLARSLISFLCCLNSHRGIPRVAHAVTRDGVTIEMQCNHCNNEIDL